MKRDSRTLKRIAVALLILGMTAAQACTGIRLVAKDGTVVHARTLEFARDLHSNVIVVPRNYPRTGTTPDGKGGLEWKTKYASMGANGVGLPFIFDGFNERGLAVGTFYFPGSVRYMPYSPSKASKTLAPWEFGSWLLENFATVDEVKNNVAKVVVSDVILKAWGFTPPVHYVVHDASGKSLVIEFIDGKVVVYDNPLGVMANSPSFDWHMTNLRNYINISLTSVKPLKLKGGVVLKPFGMGAGLHGIPGDFTPPSRFVRAVLFSQAVYEPKTGKEAVLEAFHILNNFDIPKGAMREGEEADAQGHPMADFTTWTSANDLKAKKFYFRTYGDQRIRMVDMNKMDLDAKKIVEFPMSGQEEIREITPAEAIE
ncbi:linear amide C-N hydrolase [Hydrogenimonas urashimensis]|uniref:linear amide C-N hydrolase n=1 Tax=Hydrogenimonas urashimensis TaxID=2740515 RepID=UPI0019150E21|nr:choloylglycine hydrolase family protein [Hydrogenimonas urashimensis]